MSTYPPYRRSAYPDESAKQAKKRMSWCKGNKGSSAVVLWLIDNAPPPEFIGTSLEYAYLEMTPWT